MPKQFRIRLRVIGLAVSLSLSLCLSISVSLVICIHLRFRSVRRFIHFSFSSLVWSAHRRTVELPDHNVMALVAADIRQLPPHWHCFDGPELCTHCKYKVMLPKWKPRLEACHNPHMFPLATGLRRYFSIGCVPCKAAGYACPFAKYQVASMSCMQIGYIMRHITSAQHRAAYDKQGIAVTADYGSKCTNYRGPPDSRWLWALTTVFTSSSFVDYRNLSA